MSYPQQPGGWADPTGSPAYIDPVTGAPVQPTSPGTYPGAAGYPPGPAGYPGQPGFAGYPGYAQPVMAPVQNTNGMAIASLVLALCGLVSCGVTSLVGAILGHVARRQIRERGEGGAGMALAGIVTGWIIFGLAIVGTALMIALPLWLAHTAGTQLPTTYPTN